MTDTQVALILAQIRSLEMSLQHSNTEITDRLTRLEHTSASEAQRVTRLTGRVDADIKAREDGEADTSVSRGRFIAFLTGSAVAFLGQIAAAIIPNL